MRPAAAAATERVRHAAMTRAAAALVCGLWAWTGGAPLARAEIPAGETADQTAGGATIEGSAELSTYADSDNVSVLTPTVRAGIRDDTAGYRLGARYLVDVVSAASVDIVSTASSRWREVRHALSVDGEYGPGDVRGAGSASISVEPDYLSLSAGVRPSWKLDDDHITVAVGYALGHDTIGRADAPFAVFHRTLVRHQLAAGASLVLGPASVLWLGTDAVLERGDQSKPYRYVPMFDPAAAARIPAGASPDLVNALRRDERPLEHLPTERNRYAATGRWLHRSSWATLRIEERLYSDSWGQLATTTGVGYAMDVSSRTTLTPDVRFHLQSGTSFWRRAPVVADTGSGTVIPRLRTGDRELGPLATVTAGLELKILLTGSYATTRLAMVLRVAGLHTAFRDALFISQRQAVFSAAGFEGAFE